MSQVINLAVAKCSPSKNGGFILKLQHKEVAKTVTTAFGNKTQESQATYYMKVDNAVALGFKADLDISQFRVVERPYVVEDPTSELNGQTIQLKWLHL